MNLLRRKWRSLGQGGSSTFDHRIKAAAIEGLEPRQLFNSLVWSIGPALPAAVGGAAPLVTSGTVSVFSGTNSTGAASTGVYTYDPTASQWTVGPALPQGQAGAGVGATGSSGPYTNTSDGAVYKYSSDIFLYGGQTKGQATAATVNYDPNAAGGSVNAPSMSTPRAALAYTTDPTTGQLYAIGGLNGTTALASVERYDPTADSWSAIAPLPQAVYGAAAVDDGIGHIFVFGGDDSTGAPVSTVYRYTITTDSWDTMSAMPFAASGVAAVDVAYGQIYVVGGLTATGATSSVEWYNPVIDQWNAETPLPAPVYGAALAIDGAGNVDVMGGFNYAGKAVSSMYISPVGPAPVGLPITPTISFNSNYGLSYAVYNGQPQSVTPVVYASDGYTPVAGTYTVTYNGSPVAPTSAGTYNVLATFTSADPGYVNSVGQETLYIAQASPTISLTGGGTIAYDGQTHAVTGTAIGVDGSTPVAGTFSYTYNGVTTAPVNPGAYAVTATFTPTDPNYASGTATTTITIPDPTIPTGVTGVGASTTSVTLSWNPVTVPVSGYVVYQRYVAHSPKGSGATVTYGVIASTTGTSITLSVGAQIAPNTYAIASVSPTGVISPRSADVSAEVEYGPSVSGIIVGGGYTNPVIEAGQTLIATIIAYGNAYPTFQMLSGPATMSVNSTTGVVTYSPTASEVGTNNATFLVSNAVGSVTVTFPFKVTAVPTIVVTGGNFTFDGNTHGATAVALGSDGVTPVAGTFSFLYNGGSTAPYAEAGTWSVSATFTSSDPNYGGASGTSTIVINPATPTFTVTGGTYAFDGTAHPALASAVGIDGVSPVYGTITTTYNGSPTVPLEPGQYNVASTFTSSDADYANATATTTITIDPTVTPVTPTVLVGSPTFTYNGLPESTSGVAVAGDGMTPVNGTYSVTYNGSSTAPMDAGVYQVAVDFTSSDPNFSNAIGTGTLTINAATPTYSAQFSVFGYDGTAHSSSSAAVGTDGVTPVAGSYVYTYNNSPVAPTAANTYIVAATFVSADPNYTNATALTTLIINPATPTLTLSAGPFNYDGTAHGATAAALGIDGVTPVAGSATFTYNGSSTVPTNAGTYTVAATFTPSDSNYTTVAGSTTLTINKVSPVFSNLNSPTINFGTATTVLSGTLSAGTLYPTGTSVSITLNGVTHTATLGAGGAFSATFNTANLAASTTPYTISYSFAGNTNFATATGAASLTVKSTAPVVTTSPVSQTIVSGTTVNFSAAATGTPTPTVQWQISSNGGSTWSNISGATQANYSFTAAASSSGNEYRAIFTNSGGKATTSAATLTVQSPPVVTKSPASQSIVVGKSVTFTAGASGNPAPTVQWQVGNSTGMVWTNIAGATQSTLSFSVTAQSGVYYRAVFTNSIGTATTSVATLTVLYAPVVSLSPVSQTVLPGNRVKFTAAATGSPTPTVQWQVSTNGGATWTNVSGATSTTLSITVTAAQNGYYYRAAFTNSVGTTLTGAAILTT